MDDLLIALAHVFPRWYLHGAREIRTEIRFVGDKHQPSGLWEVRLQHENGGRLRTGEGPSLKEAFLRALELVMEERNA